MKAVRYIGKNQAQIEDIAEPKIKSNEVLIKIAGAGVCHSDLHVLDEGQLPPPFTLGHENAGWIEEISANSYGYKKGDAVLVFGCWGCGHCYACQLSQENYCYHAKSLGNYGGGLGLDGGMAKYLRIPDARLLIPLNGLDPIRSAPLTDAALTPYAAIKAILPKLTPNATLLLFGIGGLGHIGLQIVKALSAVQIIAADIDDNRLAFAQQHGADFVINTSDNECVKKIQTISGERGIDAIVDFVGAQATIDIGRQVIGTNSEWTIVGLANGKLTVQAEAIPFNSNIRIPFWGSRAELIEVIALAQHHKIQIETEIFPLTDALKVYDLLRHGQIKGRAILIP